MNHKEILCMFGLGVQFHDCFNQLCLALGKAPDFLCDNSSEKWGKNFFGTPCISPEKLVELKGRVRVVITVRKYEDIYRQLRGLGLENIELACFDRSYDFVCGIKKLDNECFIPTENIPEDAMRGKWTLVTGASRGIGRQIALAMAKLGSNIIAHSRNTEHTRDVLAECSDYGVQAMPIAAELAEVPAVEAMLDNLLCNFPAIDIAFNNAAISLPCGPDPLNIPADNYLRHYTVNTVAPIRICCRLIQPMLKRGFGRIINVSSTIQKRPAEMPYACSKEALSKFVHDFSPSLKGTGVTMSLVCPGHVNSDMGGAAARHPVESVIPGALLGAVMGSDINGRFFIAQDYSGLSLGAAMQRTKFYYENGD